MMSLDEFFLRLLRIFQRLVNDVVGIVVVILIVGIGIYQEVLGYSILDGEFENLLALSSSAEKSMAVVDGRCT